MSVQKLNSSSRLKDISSLYLRSDDNQDALSCFNRNFMVKENKDVEKDGVNDLPSIPVLPATVDMDFELDRVPPNNYLLVERTESHMLTKTGTVRKEDILLSFDAYKNNIPSSSSVTQLGFMNKNTNHFPSGKIMANELTDSIMMKPKSASNAQCVNEGLKLIKSLNLNKVKQRHYNNQPSLNDIDIDIDNLNRMKPEELRPRSSIPLSKSKNLLSNIFNPADADTDYGMLNLRSISKGLRSNGVNLYLASSPPGTVEDLSIDSPRSNVGLENQSIKSNGSTVDFNRKKSSLVTNYNFLFGGYTTNKETAPLLLKTKNIPRAKFEDFYRVLPRAKNINKHSKDKRNNSDIPKNIKINTMYPVEPKTYLDEKTKRHMIVFHNSLGKSFQPSNQDTHKRRFPLNSSKTKDGVLFGECYPDILAHKNDNDFSSRDKAKLQNMMNVLFLETGQKVYTSINGQDIYEIDSGKLQAMSRRYKRNGELVAESEKQVVISEDEDADLSALKNILFLKNHQKRSSTDTVERDLEAKSLVNMSNKEFKLDIGSKNQDAETEKASKLKPYRPKKIKHVVKEKKITKPKKTTKIPKSNTKAKALEKKLEIVKPIKDKQDCSKPKMRSKNGCWTCRLRKKKCSEEKDKCVNCLRMQIPCDYNTDKPAYMATGESKKLKLLEIKSISVTNKQNSKKLKPIQR